MSCLALVAIPIAAHAVPLAGRVIDAATEAAVAGVEVRVVAQGRRALTGADGRFEIDLEPGAVELSLFRVGYEPAKRNVQVAADAAAAAPEIVVRLTPIDFEEEPVVVNAMRVQRREDPVPYANLSKEDLEERYTTQDIPVLLSDLPSSTYYSESGNGIGYNYLTLRGFDQRRLSVMINGVPQNDPEDQNVYWLDFPDLAANLQDVQVQRGAGSAFYGPPAIGGAVNLVTTVFSDPDPSVRFFAGAGSFDTQKYSVALNSGLVNGTYAFYGRYSKLLSDGYRRDSWVDFTSYFLGAARYDESMTTRIHAYGGPIEDGLAYYGVPREALDDRDARRQNPLAGGSQFEEFSQPHYELLHEWRIDERTKLSNTLFYVQGDGFFDFDGSWADTTYFRLTPEFGFDPTANPDSAIIQAFVGNKQGGWLPRLDRTHARGELTVGAELRVHRSEHWGRVRFAQNLPDGLDPNRHYYEYRGGKDIASLYGQEKLRLTSNATLTASLQLAYNRYLLYDEAFVGNDITEAYFFPNPRLGVNWNATPRTHAYASYGYVQREPRLKNLYDAAESSGGVVPQYAERPDGSLDFDDPLVDPEKLHDWELGGGWKSERLAADLGVFWMDFRDEIIAIGGVDRFGQPVTGNAARSVHRGVEIGARAMPWTALEVSGNAAWSQNRLEDYVVYVQTSDTTTVAMQLGGNSIAGFPDFVGNLRVTGRSHGVVGALAGRYVGPFFTTQFENTDQKVLPHFVLDADLAWTPAVPALAKTTFRLQVRNVLDRLYVLGGQDDQYFPAATRSFFAGVEFGF